MPLCLSYKKARCAFFVSFPNPWSRFFFGRSARPTSFCSLVMNPKQMQAEGAAGLGGRRHVFATLSQRFRSIFAAFFFWLGSRVSYVPRFFCLFPAFFLRVFCRVFFTFFMSLRFRPNCDPRKKCSANAPGVFF